MKQIMSVSFSWLMFAFGKFASDNDYRTLQIVSVSFCWLTFAFSKFASAKLRIIIFLCKNFSKNMWREVNKKGVIAL